MSVPGAALVARFGGDVAVALGRVVGAAERVALAVSGGPDSMAMLALAAAAFPGRVIVATVDHRLRAESADEAAMVAAYCDAIGIDHATLRVAQPPGAGDTLQAWAREQRYRLLGAWAVEHGAGALATAHHADDQAETFLMRAARGSGVAGLGGIRVAQRIEVDGAAITLIRPLLGWRRAALRGVAQRLPFIDDPSNADDRFDRTRFRALLSDATWLDPLLLARAAAHAAEADAALRAIEQWLWVERQTLPREVGECAINIAHLPRELIRRLVRRAIGEVRGANNIVRPDWSDATNIEPLLGGLEAGKAATQAGVLVTPRGTVWRFSGAPPRRSG